ncbi:MAG: hypothetical protein ACTS7I_02055 [Candidatus Hodgkinia cicadicola]
MSKTRTQWSFLPKRSEGLKAASAGVNPAALKLGIEKAAVEAVNMLQNGPGASQLTRSTSEWQQSPLTATAELVMTSQTH